jgi:ABC-type transport system substrate-binding protein
MSRTLRVLLLVFAPLLGACGSPWNNPYPSAERGANVLYTSFTERPKHLDPVQSYSENEYVLIANIYLPPLQYHYFKRPYELIPLAAESIPGAAYYDRDGRALPDTAPAAQIAYSVYEIRIRPGFKYQPHPAFALDEAGRPRYLDLSPEALRGVRSLQDFEHTGTRELVADDYVYQLKRLAHPRLHSPILGLMSEHIVGMQDYAQKLQEVAKRTPAAQWIDLDALDIEGVSVVDRYTYRIKVKAKYPQFVYWLAMPFFAPIPVEADRFYAQPELAERNINLDWYPVGTGPYMLTVNNPNRQMVLERNPNFPGEPYPGEGESQDFEQGLLADAGKPMPLVDRVVFSLEKEMIPGWNKFLQGYYDASGISSDTFDQSIMMTGSGDMQLTEPMRRKGIQLQTAVSPTVVYTAFNMLDKVVGGNSESARKLRQAISIALDQEEYISIFLNGRGVPAQGPIPPGIFGYLEGASGVNRIVYEAGEQGPRRRSIDAARRLLAEAGYPNGIARDSGKPLMINFDAVARGPGEKARLDWMRKQFAKLGLELVVRSTDYNLFQEKVRKGTAQLFSWGWNADYPDPENFLFLFYGPQGKVSASGENAANYTNPEYDRLFERMREMENGPERQAIIDRMLEMLRFDAPWVFGFHPTDFVLAHQWMYNRKPNKMANNGLKYQRLDPMLRDRMREEWNRPVLWPIALGLALLAGTLLPALSVYRRRERARAVVQAGA